MSDYLNDINEKRQERWGEADWHKSYIWSIKGALAMLQQTVKKPDKDASAVLLANLQHVITQLEECQYHHTMLVASDLKGMVDLPFIKYITSVFVMTGDKKCHWSLTLRPAVPHHSKILPLLLPPKLNQRLGFRSMNPYGSKLLPSLNTRGAI